MRQSVSKEKYSVKSFIRKIKYIVLLIILVFSCFVTFAAKKNDKEKETEKKEELKEFYSKFVESENTNEGVKVTIVKSDKYGDFQDEYVSVDVKVENLNRYSNLEFNIEAIDHEEFKTHNKNQRYTIPAGSNEDISFDYSFNKPLDYNFNKQTLKYNLKKKKDVKYKKDIAFARDTAHATSSYISERYTRDRERTEIEELEQEEKDRQEMKRTIMILAIVFIVVFIVLIAIYFIRRYIRTHEDFYNILLMIGLSLIISLCTILNKTNIYAYTQQTFMTNTMYSHTYTCEVWHGGIAYTFRYRVSYKYIGEVPTYSEDQDSDGDGLVDNYEVYFITDLNNADTDGDGISDYDEIYTIDTDPLKADTDKNGKDDGDEDYDRDGLTNIEEKNLGTYMNDKDSDYDGLSDYDEVKVYHTDPLKADTDNDGLSDYEEVQVAKKLGTNDISSIDTSVKFNQTLSRDNMDKNLYMNNIMSISVEGNVPGLIDKHIELKSTDNVSLTSADSVLGKPILLKSDYASNEKVTIKFDCSNYKERLEGLTVATLVNGKIKLLDTNLVDNTISAEVRSGYVFVVDGIRYIDNIFTYKKDNYK